MQPNSAGEPAWKEAERKLREESLAKTAASLELLNDDWGEDLDSALTTIKEWCEQRSLTGWHVRAIFEAGMVATFRLRPDILPPDVAGYREVK